MKKIITIILFITLSLCIQKVSFSHEIKEEQINEIIKKYIVKNPHILEKSILNYKNLRAKNKFEKILNKLKNISNPEIHNKTKNLTIFEFFDYNCGYCKTMMNTLLKTYKTDKNLSIVFVELPILSKTSLDASVAALAAHKQKKYIEYHIELMSHKGKINESVLFKIAKKLNLNMKIFKEDLSDKKLMNIINSNRKIAQQLKLRGTPAFVIGYTVYPGALKESDLKKAIKLERNNFKK
mgnify:FL=1